MEYARGLLCIGIVSSGLNKQTSLTHLLIGPQCVFDRSHLLWLRFLFVDSRFPSSFESELKIFHCIWSQDGESLTRALWLLELHPVNSDGTQKLSASVRSVRDKRSPS